MSATLIKYQCPLCAGALISADTTTCPWCYRPIRQVVAAGTPMPMADEPKLLSEEERAVRRVRNARRNARRKRRRQDADRSGAHFLDDHAGHPLGPGYPTGKSLRIDFYSEVTRRWKGESHREAWMRILRFDPCAYCGVMPEWDPVGGRTSGTVDHIEPRSKPIRGIGGAHSWINYTGACPNCNQSKSDKTLLPWMLARSSGSKIRW